MEQEGIVNGATGNNRNKSGRQPTEEMQRMANLVVGSLDPETRERLKTMLVNNGTWNAERRRWNAKK